MRENKMEFEHTIRPIAYIQNDFKEKFGIPRQSGLADTTAKIVFEPEYRSREAVRGMEMYSHFWLLWQFSESVRGSWSPTVRPPRLGGNIRMGVFATRSPFRPNSIGLSCVRLDHIDLDGEDAPALYVSGADLMDGTPIYDVKPYLPYVDSHPEALGGFTESTKEYRLEVIVPEHLRAMISETTYRELCEVLEQDPRPSYQKDPARTYGMRYRKWEVKFRVEKNSLFVCEIRSTE